MKETNYNDNDNNKNDNHIISNNNNEVKEHKQFNEISNSWSITFNKSLKDNCQLNFSKKITISCVDINGDSQSEVFDLIDFNLNMFDILCIEIDNRTTFYEDLIKNKNCFISTYLPLNKEKYRFKCDFIHLKMTENKEIVIKGSDNSYLSENFSSLYLNIFNYVKEKGLNILTELWSKNQEESKLDFQSLNPDTIRNSKIYSSLDDLDKFESQELLEISKNFSVIFFLPYIVERTTYPKPQVISNSRKPNFESLYKARKTKRKYIYSINGFDEKLNTTWIIKELNP